MTIQATADVVIIGAGVIGCSTAYHLARMGITDVAVVEMDQVGSGSSGIERFG
ncbi:MAG: FAD-binding oxidoreductase [Anaerolineales bacterium]|nr:FAD-binding oxidoreductase [Anaerolineales bacterium]